MSARRMGKIEDMRRLREQQFADNDKRANDDKRAVATTATTKDAPTAAATAKTATTKSVTPKTAPAAAADEGKCAVCGKMKALSNGLVANHQKGFGKACAGSRKEPA